MLFFRETTVTVVKTEPNSQSEGPDELSPPKKRGNRREGENII